MSISGTDSRDREWMEQALALAALAEGSTSPNPRVGAVIVREGRIVGRGFHEAPGRPHAEALAVAEAGERARGATLYVNLEPCAHHGRTPPCADLLVRSGVSRVVASLMDPNPLVDGRGFDRLRGAGIVVETGLLADVSRELNAPFIHQHLRGRPLVTIKAAISVDGMISANAGASHWITGTTARRFAHRLRLRHDAVLVGAGTVRADNPRLTVRLAGARGSKWRVVLAPGLDLDPSARMFDLDEPGGLLPRIYHAAAASCELPFAGRADLVRVGERDGGLDLDEVLADLARIGIQSILVEGGARTFGRFFDAGLVDRAAIFVSGKLIGARGGTPLLDRPSVDAPANGWRLSDPQQVALAEDLLLMGKLSGPGITGGDDGRSG